MDDKCVIALRTFNLGARFLDQVFIKVELCVAVFTSYDHGRPLSFIVLPIIPIQLGRRSQPEQAGTK